jgi:hypothetical protein
MSQSTQIGGLTVNAEPNEDGTVAYYGQFPSGQTFVISPETLTNITDPAYVQTKQASAISSLSNPSDIGAVQSFYASAPTQLPAFVKDVEGSNISSSNISDPQATKANTADASKNNLGGTASDGDQAPNPGVTQSGAANEVNIQYSGYDSGNQTIPTVLGGLSTGNTNTSSGNTINGTNTADKPGRRTQNPLGNYASWTYQISLYMITPEAYNAFVQTNRTNINANQNGVLLLVQSGGINNKIDNRAEGFEFDYYIDDLKITTNTSGKSSTVSTNNSEIEFNIYEPYGFSFLSNLRKANNNLSQLTSIQNAQQSLNPLKQFFVLGVRFQGYDIAGNLITSTNAGTNSFSSSTSPGIQEKFFDINITECNFNLDGRMIVYKIKAAATAPGQSFGIKRGRIDQGVNISAGSVDEAITQLFDKINEQQNQLAKKLGPNGKPAIQIPNVYKVRYDGETTGLKNAKIVNQATLDKFRYPGVKVQNTSQVNDATASKALPNATQKQITFKSDTPIIMAINNIITQSSYLEDALKVLYTGLEPSSDPNNPDEVKPPKNSLLQWYNLASEIKPIGWDTTLNDWAYEITYVLQPYSTPNVITPYSDKLPKYYGPHKRYDYFYTGKNSEVISFSQTLNNAFFNVYMTPDATKSQISAGISSKAGTRQNEDRTSGLGIEKEAQNSYVTSLYSPTDWAESKIRIMGDPDFLVIESPSSINAVYNQFYGPDGFTINANGGQVFIEVNFVEPVDYDNNTGKLSLNESINFWQTDSNVPQSLKDKVKGISYMVIEVKSEFSKGAFTQVLDLRLNTFPQADKEATQIQRDTNNQVTGARTDNSGVNDQAPTGATTSANLLPDQPVNNTTNYSGILSNTTIAVGQVKQINQVTVPSNSNIPISTVEEKLVVSNGANNIGTSPQVNNFVADDDGTTDVINQEIIAQASKPQVDDPTQNLLY